MGGALDGSFDKTDPCIPQLNWRSIPLQIDPFISGQIDPLSSLKPLFLVRKDQFIFKF